MLKRHAIQVLRRAGHTLEEVAELVAVGKRSVQRVTAEPVITPQVFDRSPSARRIGRPSKAEPYRARVTAWLVEEPALLSVELLRRAKLAGYEGAKSALYDLVRELRPTTPRPVVRFEGLPGEFTQHDFGEVMVRFRDGTTQRVHFWDITCSSPVDERSEQGAVSIEGAHQRMGEPVLLLVVLVEEVSHD